MDFLKNKIIREDMDNIYRGGDYQDLKGKIVLVTGPYGMLASYVMFFLLYLNEIYNYDIKIVSVSRNTDKFNKRFGRYAQLITNMNQSVNESLDIKCDYIIHAASFASPDVYETQPIDVALPNIIGTYNLLELASKYKARFLFFSSSCVYGGFEGGGRTVTESDFGSMDPLSPHSSYDESKRAGEMLCAAYNKQKGVSTIIARVAHNYGPTMDIAGDPRVFASFVKNALAGENIEMKSDGSGRRSFCYISDATTAYFKLLLEGKDGEAYNVCNTQETVSIKELGQIIADLGKVELIQTKRSANDNYLQDTSPDTLLYSNEKVKELGMRFNVDVRSGFSRVLEFYQDVGGDVWR
jgi:nucleoside-diphosphate-sugar epimerase